jgi:hypothetical protein
MKVLAPPLVPPPSRGGIKGGAVRIKGGAVRATNFVKLSFFGIHPIHFFPNFTTGKLISIIVLLKLIAL